MSEVLQQIGALKTQAKNRRDLKRYERAASIIKQAIQLADSEYDRNNVLEWRGTLASELSDCWGLLGGIERRWALDSDSNAEQRTSHLQHSMHAYDEGYRYESDPLIGMPTSTYNRLNRLLVRLLLRPERLTADGSAPDHEADGTVNVRRELESIAGHLETQGTEDIWAAADLALLNVMLGRQDALSAYATFEKKSPPDFACQSALDGIAPLVGLQLPTAIELKRAEQRLAALRDQLNTAI